MTANGWSADSQHTEKASFMMLQLQLMQDVISRCNELHVDATEYACLKAIILFRPGKLNTLHRKEVVKELYQRVKRYVPNKKQQSAKW